MPSLVKYFQIVSECSKNYAAKEELRDKRECNTGQNEAQVYQNIIKK